MRKSASSSSLPMDARAASLPKETCTQRLYRNSMREKSVIESTSISMMSTRIWEVPSRLIPSYALPIPCLRYHSSQTQLVHGRSRQPPKGRGPEGLGDSCGAAEGEEKSGIVVLVIV